MDTLEIGTSRKRFKSIARPDGFASWGSILHPVSMDSTEIQSFLGWCTLLNAAILILSTAVLLGCRSMVTKIHGKLLGLDEDSLQKAYFQYLAQFKIAVLVFNLVPYLALRIVN